MGKFNLGQTVMTRGVSSFLEEERIPIFEVTKLLEKHANGDWGNVPEEDKRTNDLALEHGDRLLSSYTLNGETVWVITEWDRSVTTVLFPSEY